MFQDQGTEIWFRDLCLDTQSRELRGIARAVRIDRRACDVLMALIENRDRPLNREEILERVWPGAAIAPGSVTVQVHALREAFRRAGCRMEPIRTLRSPARYQFCLDITLPPARVGDVSVGEVSVREVSVGEECVGARLPEPVPVEAAAGVPVVDLMPGPRRRRAPVAGLTAIACIAVLIVAAAVVLVDRLLTRPPANSVAVEPFVLLGPAQRDGDLADAVTREVVADLSHVPSIKIAAGSDAAAWAGRLPSVIGRALRVRTILEGSLTVDVAQMHVTYSLIEGATGVQLAGDSFTLPAADTSEAARLIARRVIERMLGKGSPLLRGR